MAEEKAMTMSEDLRSWGGGFLILGGLHFIIPFLASEWGVVLIFLGILSLVIIHRGMFIAIGAGLIFVGLMNFSASAASGGGFWAIFGCLQIYWGIKEMAKFSAYGKLQTKSHPTAEGETLDLESG